jgi:two-component system, LuxR family, sensor kinase FixL
LHTEFMAAPAIVMGDRVQLQQVLMNLLLNAMEAMADRPESQRHVLIRIKMNGDDTVKVSVRDSGRGIPQEKLPHLFESFYTTKEEGMGLGLAIARSTIDAHHGRISAHNNSDAGATFRFELPARNGEAISP